MTAQSIVLTGAREGLFVTHYGNGEILPGAEGVGPPAPRLVAAAVVRVAGAARRVPGSAGFWSEPPCAGCSSCTASTTSSAG
jgi:hypothetical protein